MGNDQPTKTQNQQVAYLASSTSTNYQMEQDHFILENLDRMNSSNQKNLKYIWIDPKIYNGQNQRYLADMKKQIKIQAFTSVQGMKTQLDQLSQNQKYVVICAASLPDQDYRFLQTQTRISSMILFCQKQQRAKLLINNFSKIQSAQYTYQQLITFLRSKQRQSGKTKLKNTVLVMIPQDTNLLNKNRLNFSYMCQNHNQQRAKKDLITIARCLYPQEQANIKQFQNNFKINLKSQQADQQILKWAFKKSFLWNLVDQLPKITADPKQLAYLRLPFKDLYRTILQNYKKIQKKPMKLYIVTKMNANQQKKCGSALDNFLIFTTFVKGYTNEKQAIKKKKSIQGSTLIEIILAKKQRDQSLDFGFVISQQQQQQNVIFNIYNFFKIDQYQPQAKIITVSYGALAQASVKRKDKKRFRPTPFQQDLLRNFDYLEDLLKRINNQATVLQMSGYYKQSIQIYQKKSQQLRKSSPGPLVLDKYHLQIADAYRLNQQYQKAITEYKKITSNQIKLISLVHIIQLYYQKKDQKNFKQLTVQLKQKTQQLKKIDKGQYFKAMNFIAISLMKQQKFKQANKLYRDDILPEMTVYYDFKYQGVPLVHDIFRNRAACQSKLKNYAEALNMLRETRGWQKVCQGESPNIALTQTMIQQVYLSKGDSDKAKEQQAVLHNLKQTYNKSEQTYLQRSRVIVNLNESMVNIDIDL